MSTSLFRYFYFRFACAISHRIWPWSAVENGGRRSELEMFAEHKLQPVDILREEALLSLPRDLERDSNPRRVRPAALHLHTQCIRRFAHKQPLLAVHIRTSGLHPCSNLKRPTGHCFTHSRHVSVSVFMSYHIKKCLRFAFDKLSRISNGPNVYNECRELK